MLDGEVVLDHSGVRLTIPSCRHSKNSWLVMAVFKHFVFSCLLKVWMVFVTVVCDADTLSLQTVQHGWFLVTTLFLLAVMFTNCWRICSCDNPTSIAPT